MPRTIWISTLVACGLIFSEVAFADLSNSNCVNTNNVLDWVDAPPQRVISLGGVFYVEVGSTTPGINDTYNTNTGTWSESGLYVVYVDGTLYDSELYTWQGNFPCTSQCAPDTSWSGPYAMNPNISVGTSWKVGHYLDYIDNNNNEISACIWSQITAQSAAPTSAIPSEGWSKPGVNVNLTGKGTIAPDAVNSSLSYSWNFGDGSSTAIGASVNHVFSSAGTYDVTLSAYDGYFYSILSHLPMRVMPFSPAAVTVPATLAAGL